MAKRSKIDAEKTRSQLLEAATVLFAQKGYADATISEICTTVGTTKGALFHHFSSKEELFREVWIKLQVDMDAEARTAAIKARSEADPYAAFLAGCRVFLKYASKPDFQKIVLVDGASVLGMERWQEIDHELGNENVLAGVRYLSGQGLIARENVEPMAILLQSALNGAGFALARGDSEVTQDSLFKAFEVLLKSLR